MYERSQFSWLIVGVLAAFALLEAGLAIATRMPVLFAVGALAAAMALVLSTLRVTVTPSELRWSFTHGFPGGRVALEDIERTETVPVRWWMGIGIHKTPNGWLWNVAPGNALKIALRDGGGAMIGCADPQALTAAIGQARSGRV